MSEAPRKKQRCTQQQKQRLVEFMPQHREFGLGTFTCPMGQQKFNEEWRRLAEELSELGPTKTIDQWKTTWRDLKSKAKSNNAVLYRAQRQTGNSSNVPVLSYQDEKILSVIGRISSQGIPNVPESGLGDSTRYTTKLSVEPTVSSSAGPAPSTAGPSPPPEWPAPPPAQPAPSPARSALPPCGSARPAGPQARTKIDLGQVYKSCQAETIAVLTDISNHLKRRNSIESERNQILIEKNRILQL